MGSKEYLIYVNVTDSEVVIPELSYNDGTGNQPIRFGANETIDLSKYGFTDRFLRICKGFQFLKASKILALLPEDKEP